MPFNQNLFQDRPVGCIEKSSMIQTLWVINSLSHPDSINFVKTIYHETKTPDFTVYAGISFLRTATEI